MELTTFPQESDRAELNVTLKAGIHHLSLEVVDSAGLRSAPVDVQVIIEPEPGPEILDIRPKRVGRGQLHRFEINGRNLGQVETVSVLNNDQADLLTAELLPGGTDEQILVAIAVPDDTPAGPRDLRVEALWGRDKGGIYIHDGVDLAVTAIEPDAFHLTGSNHSTPVHLTGQALESVRAITIQHHEQADPFVQVLGYAADGTSMDMDIAISTNAPFGRRGVALTDFGDVTHQPPAATFSVTPGWMQYIVMALAAITGGIHLWLASAPQSAPLAAYGLNSTWPLALIGLVYFILLGAYYIPNQPLSEHRKGVRVIFMLFSVVVIVAFLAVGQSAGWALDALQAGGAAAVVEAVLIALLVVEASRG